MTREEAIARIEDHKIAHKMNEPRAIYISEALDMAIKALKQESIIDKIRAEIDLLSDSRCDGTTVTLYSWSGMKRKVFDIIDKYKTESEGEE